MARSSRRIQVTLKDFLRALVPPIIIVPIVRLRKWLKGERYQGVYSTFQECINANRALIATFNKPSYAEWSLSKTKEFLATPIAR